MYSKQTWNLDFKLIYGLLTLHAGFDSKARPTDIVMYKLVMDG